MTDIVIPDKWLNVPVTRLKEASKISDVYSGDLQQIYGNTFDPLHHRMVCVKELPTDQVAIAELQKFLQPKNNASALQGISVERHGSVWVNSSGYVFYLVYNFNRNGTISADVLRSPNLDILKRMTKFAKVKYSIEQVKAAKNSVFDAALKCFMPMWPTKMLNSVGRGKSAAAGEKQADADVDPSSSSKSAAAATDDKVASKRGVSAAAVVTTDEVKPLEMSVAILDALIGRLRAGIETHVIAALNDNLKDDTALVSFVHRKSGDSRATIEDSYAVKGTDGYKIADTFTLAKIVIPVSPLPCVRLMSGWFACKLDASDERMREFMYKIHRATFPRGIGGAAVAAMADSGPSKNPDSLVALGDSTLSLSATSSVKSSTLPQSPDNHPPPRTSTQDPDKMSTSSKSKIAAAAAATVDEKPQIDSSSDASSPAATPDDSTMAAFTTGGLFSAEMQAVIDKYAAADSMSLPLTAGQLIADNIAMPQRITKLVTMVDAMLGGTGDYATGAVADKLGESITMSQALRTKLDKSAKPTKSLMMFVFPFAAASTVMALRKVAPGVVAMNKSLKAAQTKNNDLTRQLKRTNDRINNDEAKYKELEETAAHRDKRVKALEAELEEAKTQLTAALENAQPKVSGDQEDTSGFFD